MKNSAWLLVGFAVLPGASATTWAQDKVDGRGAYEMFNCGLCHGDDAKPPKTAGAPKIAGLNPSYIAEKTAKMSEKQEHIEAVGGSCGEVPSQAQAQAIAEWVSRQAK